jgi:hypothetical protein
MVLWEARAALPTLRRVAEALLFAARGPMSDVSRTVDVVAIVVSVCGGLVGLSGQRSQVRLGNGERAPGESPSDLSLSSP